MFELNLKIAFRNLWKNKFYTAINIFGLAAGLAGFTIILLYINKENSYDKWDPKLERSYMVAVDFTQNGAANKGSKIKALFSQVVKEQFPTVEAISIGDLNGSAKLKFESGDWLAKEKLPSVSMDENFFKVYPLKPKLGRMEDVFADKNSIAISETAAKKLFGNQDALNKVVIEDRGLNAPEGRLVVKAIWDDQKQPSYFGFHVFRPAELDVYGAELPWRNFSTMLTVSPNTDESKLYNDLNEAYIIALAKLVAKNSDVNFKPNKAQALAILKDKEGITTINLIVEPVGHLNLGTFYSTTAKQTTIYILICLASFMIIISCINYTNLALVLAQNRAKEVGVKKVLGANRSNLVLQFFTETVIQCVSSFTMALIFVELLLPAINNMLEMELTLINAADLGAVLLQAVAILVIVVLIAGAYPAIVLAGFLPVKVLKGNFSTAKHIGSLRKILVVGQFTIAIALVISFLVMYSQLNFMKNADLGLRPQQLMTLGIAKFENRNLTPEKFQSIKDRLLAVKGVVAVTRATEEPINDSGFSDDITFADQTVNVESRYVDPNYLHVIGGRVVEGRDFAHELMATDTVKSILLNETAFRKLGLTKINQEISVAEGDGSKQFTVIGKVKDIQAYGFNSAVVPTVYFASDFQWHWRRNIIIRLDNQHLSTAVREIKKVWMDIEPGKEPYYAFADDTLLQMNKTYETAQQIIFCFGMLTLLISMFGLVGFAAYSARIRTKEVALRRILGASTASLLRLLNKDFLILVVCSSLFADILAYIYMKKWFAEFAYRIPMPFEVFIGANAVVILITAITVSWQSMRAVQTKPAQVLKYE